jgi:hypothetical protein
MPEISGCLAPVETVKPGRPRSAWYRPGRWRLARRAQRRSARRGNGRRAIPRDHGCRDSGGGAEIPTYVRGGGVQWASSGGTARRRCASADGRARSVASTSGSASESVRRRRPRGAAGQARRASAHANRRARSEAPRGTLRVWRLIDGGRCTRRACPPRSKSGTIERDEYYTLFEQPKNPFIQRLFDSTGALLAARCGPAFSAAVRV